MKKIVLIIAFALLTFSNIHFYKEFKNCEAFLLRENGSIISSERKMLEIYFKLFKELDKENVYLVKKNIGLHIKSHIKYDGDISEVSSFEEALKRYFKENSL